MAVARLVATAAAPALAIAPLPDAAIPTRGRDGREGESAAKGCLTSPGATHSREG